MKWILALAPLAIGCGSSYQIPASHVQAAPQSIAAAEQVGAGTTPGAADRLTLAKHELANAQRMAKHGDKRGADLMYLRADADAQVAMLTAQNHSVVSESQQLDQQIQQLRNSSPGKE
jgi:hypothetical protein